MPLTVARAPTGMGTSINPPGGLSTVLTKIDTGTDRVPLQRQLLREMARALAGPAQGRLWIAPRQRSHQAIQLNAQLRVGLAQPLAPTARLAQSRTDFRIGAAFSGHQLGQPFAYRVRRHPRGVAHRTHATPTIGPRFGRRPMSTRSLIQHRCQRSVLRFNLLYRGC